MSARVRISNPNDNRFGKGWQKHVKSVDPTQKGGFAYDGDFLRDGTEYDLPAGAVILQTYWKGSRSDHAQYARLFTVGEKGLVPAGDGAYETHSHPTGEYDWTKDGLTLRDHVTALLVAPVKAPTPNPLAGYTDEQIKAEAVRRGLI